MYKILINLSLRCLVLNCSTSIEVGNFMFCDKYTFKRGNAFCGQTVFEC